MLTADQIAQTERRALPRISYHGNCTIAGEVAAALVVNFNEHGVCITSNSILVAGVEYEFGCRFSGANVQFVGTIAWSELTQGNRIYGVRITKISPQARGRVRRAMVVEQYKAIAKHIKTTSSRRKLLSFAKRFKDYLFALVRLSNRLSSLEPSEISRFTQELEQLNNAMVIEGEHLKYRLNDDRLLKIIKSEFRRIVSSWAFRSSIMKRGFDKPRGYPGDCRTLEIIYDRQMFAEPDDLGYYFDYYFLNNPYADAVRNRMSIIRDYLVEKLVRSSYSTFSALNLASGSCRELREMLNSYGSQPFAGKNTRFNLVDWDQDAINFSREQLSHIKSDIKFNYIQEDLLQIIKNQNFIDHHGKQDLIYSIGLADYLPDRVLKRMISFAFNGLTESGTFILAHKDRNINFSHLPPEWFCDWEFIPRNEQEVLDLIKASGISGYSYELSRDITGQIFFYYISRKK